MNFDEEGHGDDYVEFVVVVVIMALLIFVSSSILWMYVGGYWQ